MRCDAMQCNVMYVCVGMYVCMYVIYAVDIPLNNAKLTLAEHSAPSDSHTRFCSGEICRKNIPFNLIIGCYVFIRRCPENPPKMAGSASRSRPMLQPLWLSILKHWPRVDWVDCWDDDIPNWMGKHGPNHQPNMYVHIIV